jgi:hypothetical protein
MQLERCNNTLVPLYDQVFVVPRARACDRYAAGGDATELAFIACDAAVPHPPGYPTFTMLTSLSSRFFTQFPGFSPAYGSNFASAVTGAAAAGALYAAIHTAVTAAGGIFDGDGAGEGYGQTVREGRGGGHGCGAHAAAALGSGLFAFSRNVWMNSMQSEVFGLNNLFVALAILFAVRFGARKVAAAAEAEAAGEEAKERHGGSGGGGGKGGGREGSGKAPANEDESKRRSIASAAAAAAVVPRGALLREAVCGAFVCGLAMTNQHTFVLFGGAVQVELAQLTHRLKPPFHPFDPIR